MTILLNRLMWMKWWQEFQVFYADVKKYKTAFFLFIVLSFLYAPAPNAEPISHEYRPWAVYYSSNTPIETFEEYKLLVLDSDYHPPLRPLLDKGKLLLGYISLGEVEQERSYFDSVKDEGILLYENKNWKGSYYVDMRDKRWPKRVIETLIPEILRQGFDGLFFDTLDNPIELERTNPKKYKGMTAAAANLIKAIRLHYPNIKIMMNRGYELLPLVTKDIDMVLGESVYADYDFDKKINKLVAKKDYQEQVRILKQGKKRNPTLGIYTLDYWNKDDPQGIANIYKEQRSNGFIPYVATIKLDEIIKEPKEK